MNHSLLRHLQSVQGFPCITLLQSTAPGPRMASDDIRGLLRLSTEAASRLAGRVDDALVDELTRRLDQQIAQAADDLTTEAIALCVSPAFDAVVRLGVPVRSRCIVDDTFATRDMVLDSKRTAVFRLVTVSERRARVFVGDRRRLIEERSDGWPLERADDESDRQWTKAVIDAVDRKSEADPLPMVLAGVERTTRQMLAGSKLEFVASISGNHDRTGWSVLHSLAWPLVERWLRCDRDDALRRLEAARSARRFAAGVGEVWDLARDGRVELLVVEQQYEVPALIGAGALQVGAEDTVPGTHAVDDAVDDLIEMVLRSGGEVVMVDEGDLRGHGHLAAVLRY
jgi:hypothetical protein